MCNSCTQNAEADFGTTAGQFQQVVEQASYRDFCTNKLAGAATDEERSTWKFLSILLEDRAVQKEQLLQELGYVAPVAEKEDTGLAGKICLFNF